jgi:Zn-dependent protease
MLAYLLIGMQTGPEFVIFSVLILIFSVIIHEVAHGWAANALGDPTAKLAKRLTLNPLRHIDPIGTILVPGILLLSHSIFSGGFLFGWAKPVPYNPYNLRNQRWGEAFVAIAGVATNLFLAVLFGFLARYAYGAGSVAFGDLAALITLVNLFLGIFNLLPIPPLDGYTFLRSILPHKRAMAFRAFENRLMQGGFLTLIVFLLVFSYFLAKPFSALVFYIFRLLIGV